MASKIRRRRMYAVSAEGYGLIAGTLAYTRRDAILRLQQQVGPGSFCLDWSAAKKAGYRTVQAVVEISGRFGTWRSTRH